MKKLFTLLFLLPLAAACQVAGSSVDSLQYYRKALTEKVKLHNQKLRQEPEYAALQDNIGRLRVNSDSYNGFILYTQATGVNFSRLNSDLTSGGYPSLSGPLWSIGYGLTFKKGRRIFDLNGAALGLKRKSEVDKASVAVSFETFLEATWGYDFIRSNRINLYPYLGLGLRTTEVEYDTVTSINPSPTNITNIILNNRSATARATEIGYLAGIGLEYVLTSKNRPGGTLLFVKGGTSRPFKRKALKVEETPYNPQLEPGNFVLLAGFKFFFK